MTLSLFLLLKNEKSFNGHLGIPLTMRVNNWGMTFIQNIVWKTHPWIVTLKFNGIPNWASVIIFFLKVIYDILCYIPFFQSPSTQEEEKTTEKNKENCWHTDPIDEGASSVFTLIFSANIFSCFIIFAFLGTCKRLKIFKIITSIMFSTC